MRTPFDPQDVLLLVKSRTGGLSDASGARQEAAEDGGARTGVVVWWAGGGRLPRPPCEGGRPDEDHRREAARESTPHHAAMAVEAHTYQLRMLLLQGFVKGSFLAGDDGRFRREYSMD